MLNLGCRTYNLYRFLTQRRKKKHNNLPRTTNYLQSRRLHHYFIIILYAILNTSNIEDKLLWNVSYKIHNLKNQT